MVGIALLAVGAAALGVGTWSAVTARRPAWLSAKALAADTVRLWGAGTALAGVGVGMFGIDELLTANGAFGLTAFVLIVSGAGLVIVATPRSRRSR